MPLWYAHYDNNPSFSDFSPFGGWKEPYAKQVIYLFHVLAMFDNVLFISMPVMSHCAQDLMWTRTMLRTGIKQV